MWPADGNHFAIDQDGIILDILNFLDVHYIWPVHFHEQLFVHPFFHTFNGSVGYIVLIAGDVFEVVAKALNIQDIIQLAFTDQQVIIPRKIAFNPIQIFWYELDPN